MILNFSQKFISFKLEHLNIESPKSPEIHISPKDYTLSLANNKYRKSFETTHKILMGHFALTSKTPSDSSDSIIFVWTFIGFLTTELSRLSDVCFSFNFFLIFPKS